MPPKTKSSTKFKGTKNKPKGEFFNFQRSIKKYSFSELEGLIQQARQAKKKPLVQKYKALYRQKLNAWARAWELGRQKLIAQQKAKKIKREAREQAQKDQEQSRRQHKKRLGEIYHHFQQELNKLDKSKHPQYFTPHLNLDPQLTKALKKKSRQHPDYDFFAEFRRNPRNLVYRLNKGGRDYLLRKTTQAYQEEIAEQASQIRYWQENSGLTKIKPSILIKKGQKIKFFFPEKGEHKDFFRRKREFKRLWEEILTVAGRIQDRNRVSELSKQLYLKSPWRIRDRLLITTDQKVKSWGMDQIWQKYYKNNPFPQTKKYYYQAIAGWLNSTQMEGEVVPDNEIDFDKYGYPRFKEGQWISPNVTSRPGRSWTVYKNVPSWEEQERKKIHEVVHEKYIINEGSELEIQAWKLKKNRALCWVEAIGLGSCATNQGTSTWWCLFCIVWGPYHPPVLPKHCSWLYTYKTWLCGTKEHSDANKQWHFSVEGERVRDAIKGGDWGSCHIGTFDKKKLKKQKRK